jgi:hypothetical protein
MARQLCRRSAELRDVAVTASEPEMADCNSGSDQQYRKEDVDRKTKAGVLLFSGTIKIENFVSTALS